MVRGFDGIASVAVASVVTKAPACVDMRSSELESVLAPTLSNCLLGLKDEWWGSRGQAASTLDRFVEPGCGRPIPQSEDILDHHRRLDPMLHGLVVLGVNDRSENLLGDYELVLLVVRLDRRSTLPVNHRQYSVAPVSCLSALQTHAPDMLEQFQQACLLLPR